MEYYKPIKGSTLYSDLEGSPRCIVKTILKKNYRIVLTVYYHLCKRAKMELLSYE